MEAAVLNSLSQETILREFGDIDGLCRPHGRRQRSTFTLC